MFKLSQAGVQLSKTPVRQRIDMSTTVREAMLPTLDVGVTCIQLPERCVFNFPVHSLSCDTANQQPVELVPCMAATCPDC